MFRTIIDIILVIIRILLGLNNNSTKNRLEEDEELADAIRDGDGQKVGEIREGRKHYKCIPFIFLLLVLGCAHPTPILTEGSKPYALPPGIYKDVHGMVHNEAKPRWSLSEADLFRDSQSLSKTKKKINPELVTQLLLGSIIIVTLLKGRK